MDYMAVACVLGAISLPLVALVIVRSWNEVWYVFPLKKRCKGANIPPGHMGLPFLGELLTFLWYFKVLRRPDDFIMSLRNKFGYGVGLYRTHLFGSPTIIACDPAVNKFILHSPDLFLITWPAVELVGHNAFVALNGERHDRLRSFVMNAINGPGALKRICAAVQPHIVSSLHQWAEKGRIKACDETKKVTFENICKMFVSMEPGPFLDKLNRYVKGVTAGFRAQPLNIPGSAHYHALQCRRKLTAEFRKILEARNKLDDEKTNDLMDGLRQIKDTEEKPMGDDAVVDNIVSLIIGGFESTSNATMWSLYYLYKFPNVLQQLKEESMAINKGKKGEFITMDDISQMKYTKKVVEETIRMANIAPFVYRHASKDVDYKGYRIPKDWQVIIWLRHLHTDPKNFEHPLQFNPDRWDETPKQGVYQVFGSGPRLCAGNMLARLQMCIFLYHVTTCYRWELTNPNAKIRYLPHPRPEDGAEMTFQAL